jgi:ABC-type multidrug transport system ATPase subunit
VFVSTHLISEFEGLIDEFTIIDRGREVLTLDADAARERYRKIHARFAAAPAGLEIAGSRVLRRDGRELEIVVNGNSADVIDRLRAHAPETLEIEALSLEEIFVSTVQPAGALA